MSAADKKLRRYTNQIRRAAYAFSTFEEIIATCLTLVSGYEGKGTDPVYLMAVTGVVVAYRRPFDCGADGLGSLGRQFESFPPDSPHKKTHEDLVAGRNSAFAHYSPQQAATLLEDPTEQASHADIIIEVSGTTVNFRPKGIEWHVDRLHAIVDLCRFQQRRLEMQIRPLLQEIRNAKHYPDGSYVLGKNFP